MHRPMALNRRIVDQNLRVAACRWARKICYLCATFQA